MTGPPKLIDNRDGNTLRSTLRSFLGASNERTGNEPTHIPDSIRIATAYFNPAGFAHIADQLRPVHSVRLLLGADPATILVGERKKLDETPSTFQERQMRAGLNRMDSVLHQERDGLPFTRPNAEALHKLINALQAGNLEVKRYEAAFLHAKAYIVSPSDGNGGAMEGLIVGSSNLTGAGLTRNLELNLGCHDRTIVERGRQWFEDLWEDAIPYDLAAVFEDALVPHEPWEIFIRVLWHLYGVEVENDSADDSDLPLTNFQKHGVERALRLIRDMGGVIVADEVGLGKTFIAGEILKVYHDRRQRALLICPASLRDTTWDQFLTAHEMFCECLSFEQLANDRQLKDAQRPNADQRHIKMPIDEYQLVIIDEAHNYRNPDAPTRAGALRKLLFGKRRDLLLLTATPVNNSLWDIYHLIRFFLRQDAHLSDRGILSIRERFERAMREDPSSLSPDILYPVIDATTVKRTRQFVKKHYSSDTIKGPDGKHQPIVFPSPKAISIRYDLDGVLPGFFDELERALDPDHECAIGFARYMPEAYSLERNGEEDARARALVGLLRSGLLKRFESSVLAFRRTIRKMVSEHDVFIQALDAGYVVRTGFMEELSADDSVFEDILRSSGFREDAAPYEVERLRAAVERDRLLLQGLLDQAEEVTADRDPKLQAFSEALGKIVASAEREAINSDDERQKRKVLVFSFFEDTVKWIQDYLEGMLTKRSNLACYDGRIVVISGSGNLTEVSRQKAVQGFAPVSMEVPGGQGDDLYDLMIATDVLAEGVNLQQCRNIINFDMPWNPMRLVQRHGRIDRIGSPHNRVFLRTMFPADRLDRLLNLEQRILDKLAMAAASIGVMAPIEGAAHGRQVFTETRREIERLLDEDSSLFDRGGTASAAQTGEEYRQTLRKALQGDHKRIASLPWKAGSGMAGGARRGIFFCAVVGKGSDIERTYLRFVAADGEWRPSLGDDAVEREMGTCLRLIECSPDTPKWYPDWLEVRVYDFWEVAQSDILRDWMRETDPANLQPAVRPLNHRVAMFIREHPPRDELEERINDALDILESPWPRREELMLREWFEAGEHEGGERSRRLIGHILDTGLEPAKPPPPLPPIDKDDIGLLCWMGIEAETDDREFNTTSTSVSTQ